MKTYHPMPEPDLSEYSGQFTIRIPKIPCVIIPFHYTNFHLLNSNRPAPAIRIDPRIVKSLVPGPPVFGRAC